MSKINYYIRSAAGSVALTLGPQLGEGATAAVYEVVGPQEFSGLAAKIYSGDHLNQKKVELMVAEPPRQLWHDEGNGRKYPQFAWPQHLVYKQSVFGGALQVIGFLMPMVSKSRSETLDHFFDTVLSKRMPPPSVSLPRRIEVARNLARLLEELHTKGIYCVDFKPHNIHVGKNDGLVTLLDCDSYAIIADGTFFPATQFSCGYTAPEALKANAGPQVLGQEQDLFAMAVIFFQLLNYGIHPYAGILQNCREDLHTEDDLVRAEYYAYGLKSHPNISPKRSSVHDCFPKVLREYFDQAFSSNQRPLARQWAVLFEQIHTSRFEACPTYPTDVEHIRFRGMPCLRCERDLRIANVRAEKTPQPPQNLAPATQNSVSNTSSHSSPVGNIPPTNTKGSGPGVVTWTVVGVSLLIWFATSQKPSNQADIAPPSPPALQAPENVPAQGNTRSPSFDFTIEQPVAGGVERGALSKGALYYCLSEEVKLKHIIERGTIQPNSQPFLSGRVADYNARCSNYRYIQEDLSVVTELVAQRKLALHNDAEAEEIEIRKLGESQNQLRPAPSKQASVAKPPGQVQEVSSSRRQARRIEPEPNIHTDVGRSAPVYKPSAVDLSQAIERGYPRDVDYFIKNGADLNAAGKNKKTPLVSAILNRSEHWIRYLVAQGADPNAANGGVKPMRMARLTSDQRIINLMQELGATD